MREVDAKGAAMVSLHWRTSHDLETVWTEGCLIPTTGAVYTVCNHRLQFTLCEHRSFYCFFVHPSFS